jgi:hypothetical protein
LRLKLPLLVGAACSLLEVIREKTWNEDWNGRNWDDRPREMRDCFFDSIYTMKPS